MYTRPRHSHHPIPSISTFSPYPSPSHILNKSEDLAWYTPPETLLPSPLPLPLPPPPPPPPAITRRITKPNRIPHLPAEKNAALKAAQIAKECQDLGPHTAQRFKCPFPACNKFFQRRYNFKVHVRKHTKETPYTCTHPGCGKKFRWRSSISHHLKAHNKRDPRCQKVTQHPFPLPSTSVSYNTNDSVSVKLDHPPRRTMLTTHLPTSPISSGTATANNDRFQGFGLEHVPLEAGADVGIDELTFHHEHVTGMMFDNIM